MNTRTNMEKRSPLSCWTSCPSEPKLGNVTTGLERDSLNRIENLKVPICTRNVYLIKALSCFENCGIKKSKFWYKLYSFLQILYSIFIKERKGPFNQDPFFYRSSPTRFMLKWEDPKSKRTRKDAYNLLSSRIDVLSLKIL